MCTVVDAHNGRVARLDPGGCGDVAAIRGYDQALSRAGSAKKHARRVDPGWVREHVDPLLVLDVTRSGKLTTNRPVPPADPPRLPQP